MSALADEPDHFRRWSGEAPEAFARRVDYGRYVKEVLADAIATSSASLRHVAGVAERFDPTATACASRSPAVRRSSRTRSCWRRAWRPRSSLPYLRALADDERLIADPWAAGALDAIVDGETSPSSARA